MDFRRLPSSSSLRHAILHRATLAGPSRRHISSTPSHGHDSPSALLALSSSTLNSYALSCPPTLADLKRASPFFTRSAPQLLFSTPTFRAFPPSPHPEVAFLGRSNVGKSSLLNALFGRPREKPAHVSKRPGRTRTMNGFGVGGGKEETGGGGPTEGARADAWRRFRPHGGGLVVVDMPGYGGGSRESWGTEIVKYLENRRQLRRTYVLVDAQHGLKTSDVRLLVHLRCRGIAHQLVLSKVDKLLFPGSKSPGPKRLHDGLVKLARVRSEVGEALNRAAGRVGGRDDVLGDILCCSAEKTIHESGSNRRGIGIDEVRWSILTACGLEDSELPNTKGQTVKIEDGRDGEEVLPYKAFS